MGSNRENGSLSDGSETVSVNFGDKDIESYREEAMASTAYNYKDDPDNPMVSTTSFALVTYLY
jgi:hypothetical protein